MLSKAAFLTTLAIIVASALADSSREKPLTYVQGQYTVQQYTLHSTTVKAHVREAQGGRGDSTTPTLPSL